MKWRLSPRRVRWTVLTGVFLGAICLSGCLTPSIHPLYAQKGLILLPGLEGFYADSADENTTWKFFRKRDAKAYTLIITEGKDSAVFNAHLVRIDSQVYMDTTIGDNEKELNGGPLDNLIFACHLVGAHLIWRVDMTEDGPVVFPLNSGWLESALEEKRIAVKHETIKDEEDEATSVLLTASTTELQAFIKSNSAGLFEDDTPLRLTRVVRPTNWSGNRAHRKN